MIFVQSCHVAPLSSHCEIERLVEPPLWTQPLYETIQDNFVQNLTSEHEFGKLLYIDILPP